MSISGKLLTGLFSHFSGGLKKVLVAGVLLLAGVGAFATDYTWTGNTNAGWMRSGNWTPTGYPNSASDNATISSATRQVWLETNKNATANNVTVNVGSELHIVDNSSLTCNTFTVTAHSSYKIVVDGTSSFTFTTLVVDDGTTVTLEGNGSLNGAVSGSGTLDLSGFTGSLDDLDLSAFAGTISGVDFKWSKTAADTDWTNTANWEGGKVPVAGSVIIIQAQTSGSNNPVYSEIGATYGSLTVESGASLTFKGNMTLTASGDAFVADGDIFVDNGGILSVSATGSNSVIKFNGNLDMTTTGTNQLFQLSATKEIAVSGNVTGTIGATYGDDIEVTAPSVVFSEDVSTNQINIKSGTEASFAKDVTCRLFVLEAADSVAVLSESSSFEASYSLTNKGSLTLKNGGTVGSYTGTGSLTVDSSAGNIDLTINADSTVADLQLKGSNGIWIYGGTPGSYDKTISVTSCTYDSSTALTLYGKITIPGGSFASLALEDGSVKVNGDITLSGTLLIDGTGQFTGDITADTVRIYDVDGSIEMLTAGSTVSVGTKFQNDNSGTFTHNNSTVKFTGATGSVTGNNSFYNLNAAACTTSISFDGDLTVTGTFTAGKVTNLSKNVDFSGATGFVNSSGTINYYNTSADEVTFKTMSGQSFNNVVNAGNIKYVLNGAVRFSSFKCPARGVKTIGRPWTLYLTRTDSTSGATIVNKCDLENANVNTDAAMTGSVVIQAPVTFNNEVVMHVGMQLVVDTDGKVEITHANGLYANTSSDTPSMSLTVKGQLKTTVLDLANGNTQYVPVTVESSGKLIADSITFTSASCTYTDVILANKGSVEAGSISLPKQIIVNDGTITLKDGAGLTAKKVINSGSDNASGVIECVIDAGDGSETSVITSSSTTDTSYQKTISVDGLNITLKGLWSLDDFTADTNMGDKTVTLNGSSVAVNTLSLAGSAGNLLNIAGTAAGDGFVFTADQTGGDYLSINDKILIKDSAAATASGTYTYKATNSVPSAGSADADYLAVIHNGWDIKDLKEFTFTWTGTTSTAWNVKTNWDTGFVPVAECRVIIPDSVTSNRWPVLTTSDAAVSIGTLSVGTAASSGAKITLADKNISLSGTPSPFVNYGTVIYTDAGRITDGANVINDDANNGTVQYAGTTGGTVSNVSYANLVVSASEWSAADALSVAGNLSVTGGKLSAADDVSVTRNMTVSGGTYAASKNTSVTGTTTVSGTGQADFGEADGLDSTDAVTISGGKFSGVLKSADSISVTGACSATDDFVFESDVVNLNANISAAAYNASVHPATDTVPVVLGSAVAGSLCFTDAQLDRIQASKVTIGRTSNSKDILINAAITSAHSLELVCGGSLTQSGTGIVSVSTGDLGLTAKSGIGEISGNSPFTTGTIAGTVSAEITDTGDIYLKTTSTAAMNIGGAGSKVILTPHGNIKIETAGNIVIGGDIEATAGTLGLVTTGGSITRTAGTLKSNSTVTLQAKNSIGSGTPVTPVEVECTNVKAASTNGAVYISQNGTMTVSAADDISASGEIVLKAKAFDLTTGAIAAGSGTVTLTGYDSTTPLTLAQAQIDGINTTTSTKLILGDSAHTGGITVSGNVNLSNFTDTTFASKTFTSTSAVISGGKVILLPVENEITLNGGFTFSELEAKNLGGKTIKFAAGTTTNVTDKLTLSGTSKTSRLVLRSTTDDSQWTINCTCDSANTDIQFVDVQDSNNTSTYSAAAYDLVAGPLTPVAASYDSGNNDNWSFPGQPYTWKGSAAAGANEWKVKANWEQNSVPSKGGYVSIPAGKTDYPVLTSSIDIGSGTLTVEGTSASVRGQIDFATFDFTAAKITNNGLVRIEGGNTLTVNGVVVSTDSTTALVNAAYSTVEYYGDCRAASLADGTLPWGKSYANLEFTSGAQASLPLTYAITVTGTTLITNGAGNEITMEGANRFTGAVTLGDFANTLPAGNITLSGANTFTGGVTVQTAGDVVLNSSAAIVLADFGTDYSCNSLEITSASTVQNVNTTHAQTFTGAVTLRSDAEFTAGAGEKVWFKSTVTGGNSLANARALTVTGADAEFDGAVGNGTDYIKSISVDGETLIKGVILNVKTSGADGGFMLFKGNVTLDGGDVELKGNTTPCTFEGTVGSNTSLPALARGLKLTGSNDGMNGVFQKNVGGDTNLLKALSVSGTTEFGAAVDSVKTLAGQIYTGDVTFANNLTLTSYNSDPDGDGDTSDAAYSTVTFKGDVTGAADLTVDGIITAASPNHVIDLRTSSAYGTGNFNQGFTAEANVTLKGNFNISKDNIFAQLVVDNSEKNSATSVTFDKDSTQTIRNAASATDVYWAGYSETNPLTITGGAAGESWKTVFINKPVAANFSYVIIENSHSVTSAGLANDLKIVPSVANVQDSDNSAYTTKYWFAYDFYWFGKTDTSWYDKSNWSYSPDTYSSALGYPDYQNGTSDVVIVDNDTNELVLENAIDVNSIHVYEGKTVDFATYNVTLTKATDSLDNEGLVRLSGENVITAGGVVVSTGSTTAVKNGTNSTVEYYGTCGTVLSLGYTYNNLEFTTGSSADVAAAITVNGTTLFASGTGNNISLTGGNRFVEAVTMGNDTDQAGNVTLNGNNRFASDAKITIKSADDVILNGTGIVINAGAECDSLNVKSAATIGSVTTTSTIGATSDTQYYEGNLTLSSSAAFKGTAGDVIHFGGNVTGSDYALTVTAADALCEGDISTNAISMSAACKFDSSSVQNVTTVWGQGYTGSVTISTGISIKAASNVIFKETVEGPGSLAAEVYGSKPFTADKTIGAVTPLSSVSIKAGTAVLHGVTTDGTLQITAAPSSKNASGVYEWGTSTASNTITLYSDDYVSDAAQTLSAAGGVRFLAGNDGSWSAGTSSITLSNTDLFFDAGVNTVTVGSNLNSANAYFYNGTIATAKQISTSGNMAVFGSGYNAKDVSYGGTNSRFAYWHETALNYYPGSSSFASNIVTFDATPSAAFTFTSGARLAAGGNFYVNGTDLADVTVSVPANEASNPVFNDTASVTKEQWGLPYAVVFNSTVSNVTASDGWIGAASEGQGCIASGTNSKVQFDIPHIEKAYTVYDDVIFVKFDRKVENSHGEIKQNIVTLSSSGIANGGVWYNKASSSLKLGEGVYSDPECTTEISATEDIDQFYIRTANELWNTDATGKASANASSTDTNDSTDRNGVHHDIKVDLNFLEGLFTAADGHTLCRSYGEKYLYDGTAAGSYEDTEDHASPVLIAVYTGQENHTANTGTASSQSEYDGHNFIEFRYSECVDIGDMIAAGGTSNARATSSFTSASEHGGEISASGTGLDVSGYGTIENGVIAAGVKTGTDSPHALYRTFSTTAAGTDSAQTHRIRVSVAGFVDGTVLAGSFHNWIGYIDSAETPAGKITRSVNANIKDIATDTLGNSVANELDSTDHANHPLPELTVNGYADGNAELYGEWDVQGPILSPFSTSTEDWSNWGLSTDPEFHEIIGSSAGGSSLENIEIHFLDNNRNQVSKWPGKWWRTKLGWKDGDAQLSGLPETRGGARPFNGANATYGGIRRSSLDGANSSFSYISITDSVESPEKTIGTGYIGQTAIISNIFRTSSDPATQNDGSYLSLPLNAADTYLAIRSTFKLYYNPENDYITDLAGNRLASSYSGKTEFNSVDLTPPAYTMTLSPVAQNKIYTIFTKRLAYVDTATNETEYLDKLSPAEKITAMNEIKDSFIICQEGTTTDVIGIENVEYVSGTNEYTALLFTLDKKVTLANIENLWIRNVGHGSDTIEDASGFTVANTKINDYIGNFLAKNKAHAISDFAVNAAKVIYAFGHDKNDDGWDEKGIYGTKVARDADDYPVHDFTAAQGNYGRLVKGRDITLQVQLVGGVDGDGNYTPAGETFVLIPSKKAALSSSMVSDKINKMTGFSWRLWLPTALTSLATDANTNLLPSPATPTAAGDDEGLLWNYQFPDSDYNFVSGDEIQFVFQIDGKTIDHDGDTGDASATPRVPLYAVSMPESRIRAGDFSFIDLWSFGIKDIKKQRGGVTILNNVIDVSVKEETVLEVELEEAGNLNIYVLTADGNIVKQLSKGQVSAGTHYYKWNGTNNKGNSVARGIYFVRIIGNGIDETRKVLCVK